MQSAYNGKWDGTGIHSWEGLQARCQKDGFKIVEVKQDPATGVRRVTVERSGKDPRSGKDVSGRITKTIYPPKLSAQEIDAAGEQAFQAALRGDPGTKLTPFGANKKADGSDADGYFDAVVRAPGGQMIRIQGWFKEHRDASGRITRTISSHTPAYDKNWPATPPADW